jgi:hypothetical protein
MANFATSALVAGQTKFTQDVINKTEFRLPDVAATRIMRIAGMHNPSLESVRVSGSRTVNAYFPIRQAATNGSARSALHTGARGDSTSATYSWTTFEEPFSISMNQAQNNVMTFAEMYASARRNAILNILNRIDAFAVSSLLSDKSGYNVGGANGTFNATDDVYEVANADKDYFFSEVKTMMEQNLYMGALVGVVDAKGKELARRVGNQGTGNSTNLSYTVDGYTAITPSTRTIVSGTEGSGIFFDPSTVALVPWVQPDYRKSINPELAMNGVNGDRGSFSIPELPGITFMEKIYTGQSDASSLQGTVDDIKVEVQISVDVAYSAAPISTLNTDESSIFVASVLS